MAYGENFEAMVLATPRGSEAPESKQSIESCRLAVRECLRGSAGLSRHAKLPYVVPRRSLHSGDQRGGSSTVERFCQELGKRSLT